MDDHGSSNDRVWAVQTDQSVGEVELGHSVVASGHVTEIADMSLLSIWRAVGLAEWVEVSAGAGAT